jgi:hypothetical protein
MTPKPPTRSQMSYLRALANRTGQTFTYPRTSFQASQQIRRLKTVTDSGMTIAELETEYTARELTGDRIPSELAGFRSRA